MRSESLKCHVVLHEREVKAVEKLRQLDLIPHSTLLSLQVAYFKTSNIMLKSLLKTEAHLKVILGEVR